MRSVASPAALRSFTEQPNLRPRGEPIRIGDVDIPPVDATIDTCEHGAGLVEIGDAACKIELVADPGLEFRTAFREPFTLEECPDPPVGIVVQLGERFTDTHGRREIATLLRLDDPFFCDAPRVHPDSVREDDFMLRHELASMVPKVLATIDPANLVVHALDRTDQSVRIGTAEFDLERGHDVTLIAIGKAAAAMATGAASVFGHVNGVAVADSASACPVLLLLGDHPVPGGRSLFAGRAVTDVLCTTKPDDVVCFLVSGGGSALVEAPVPGMSIEALGDLHRSLLLSGAPIEDINEVRAGYSLLKAGRLRDHAETVRTATLVLSDVVGAPPEVVSSGPSISSMLGRRSSLVLADHGLDAPGVPVAGRAEQRRPEPVAVVGSPETAACATIDLLSRAGRDVQPTPRILSGPITDAVASLFSSSNRADVVAAGEVSVHVDGPGRGGRNQHAALLAARAIAGTGDVFLALGTDGRDGGTEAAGAVVDGGTLDRVRSAGIDPDLALADFDSHRALEASGDLIVTGPTGTNVADLWVRVVNRRRRATP